MFGRVSAKISKFKLKQVCATRNTSMRSRAATYVQNLKTFFDLNNCWYIVCVNCKDKYRYYQEIVNSN
jgi:hypothetical protein